MANERPAKRRCFTSDVVTIKAGKRLMETFTIHADVLQKHSPFFKAALDRKWKEGQSLQIDLPEDHPDIIEAYFGWLHDGKLEFAPSPENDDLTFPFLAKLYVLGEKIQDSVFCNEVIDSMIKTADQPNWMGLSLPSGKAIRILYAGTPQGSPARGFFVDWSISSMVIRANESDDLPLEFLKDALEAATSKLPFERYKAQFPDRKKWHKAV